MAQNSTCFRRRKFVLLVAVLVSIGFSAKADVIPPTVVSTTPGSWSININAGTTVSAVFSEAMNAATITGTTFQLRNALTNTLVPATVTYNTSTRTATLYPNSVLNSLVYLVNIDGGTGGVRDAAGNAMTSDYSWYFIMIPLIDLTPPIVLSVSPANGTTGVSISTNVQAILSEEMMPSSINTTTVELRNPANVLVASTVSYNSSTRTITLDPGTSLSPSTVYRATVKGGASGVKDENGNPLQANYTWSFTTMAADNTPPTITGVSPVNGATSVAVNTTVSAIFSEAMNTATISTSTFELRNGSALIAATVNYNVTTRTATLIPSSSLASTTVYTATVKGGLTGVKDVAGNAMVNNYTWSFTTADVAPPVILSVSPTNGATGISVSTTASAVFNEAMNASTIGTATFELRNSSNTLIPATVSYNVTTKTVTLTPSSLLAPANVYTATIKGGSSGVKDAAGNAMVNNYIWSFTTGASIFDPDLLPDNPAIIDQPVEVGLRFRSNVNGQVTGLRFYKGLGNNGTHIGHLWTNTGTLLGSVTFTQESQSGWQQVMFSSPVTINAGVTYVASYYSVAGIYAYTNYFFTQSYTNGPLTALADGDDGSNGIYRYGPTSSFPTDTYLSSNYFVDVIFSSNAGPDLTPPAVATVSPLNGTTGVNISTTVKATFNEPLNGSTVNSTSFELRNAVGTLIPATVTYSPTTMTAVLTPTSPLVYYAEYTAKVKGGSTGVKDLAGNPLANDYSWTFRAGDPPFISPTEGPGGPILVISSSSNPFSRYAVEILRAEGLNEFAAADISTVTPSMLDSYDVVVLGEMPVTADQVLMFTTWVTNGGTLIAFRPSTLLAPLLGLTPATGSLSDKYMLINTASGPGSGIVGQTIQYHGQASLYLLAGATSIATLYSNASNATIYPAVTTRDLGISGGRAIAFTYDLAKSIVYTRQGNPAWAGQKRDGQIDPIRSDDMFFPDWIDFNKIAIPQADEQQRLLANIILQGNLHRKPLPRFWYLPRDLKAAIVMTGDDHSNNGTQARFNQYKTLGPNTVQDVADWKAIRGTSYMYPGTPISNATAAGFEAQGFEVACHPTTSCLNFTPASLQNDFTTQLAAFASSYPSVSTPVTNRTHCLVWSDWASHPKVELQKGIRLDATYYYWPEVWMQNRPGMFTGSGMPMRFADVDGSMIDVYQAPTQMTDETNMNYTAFCNAVLDKAIGPEGYYGVFTTNMHNDSATSAGADAIIASAQARQVPVISARQMLTWLDARNNSSFGNISWNNNQLIFTITARSNSTNLKAMLPMFSASGQLISITKNGSSIPFTSQVIKGMQYAFFATTPGINNYVAIYGTLTTRTANPPVPEQNQPQTETVAKTENAQDPAARVKESLPVLGKLYASALPNPSSNYFNVVISSNDPTPVTVRVFDMSGRVVEVHEKIAATGILRMGSNWRGGIYFAEVIQGEQRRIIRMIKAN